MTRNELIELLIESKKLTPGEKLKKKYPNPFIHAEMKSRSSQKYQALANSLLAHRNRGFDIDLARQKAEMAKREKGGSK